MKLVNIFKRVQELIYRFSKKETLKKNRKKKLNRQIKCIKTTFCLRFKIQERRYENSWKNTIWRYLKISKELFIEKSFNWIKSETWETLAQWLEFYDKSMNTGVRSSVFFQRSTIKKYIFSIEWHTTLKTVVTWKKLLDAYDNLASSAWPHQG